MLGINSLVSGSWGWAGAPRVAGGQRAQGGVQAGQHREVVLLNWAQQSFYVLTTGTVLPLHAGWILTL